MLGVILNKKMDHNKNNKSKNRKKNSHGFAGLTLMELVVVIGVFSITMMATMATFSAYYKNRKAIKRFQESNEEISLALNYLTKDIRMSNCNKAECGCSAGGHESLSVSFCDNIGDATVTYQLDGTNLTRNGEVIATDVGGNFYASDGEIKRYTLSIWKKDQTDRPFQSTVSARGGYK